MKYTTNKTRLEAESETAKEITRILNSYEPVIGNTVLANMMGMSPETINSVVYRGRIPGVGLLNGLARALKLDEATVGKLFELHEQDVKRAKIKKVAESISSGMDGFASILEVLDEAQLQVVKTLALKLAKTNLDGK